MKRILSLTRVGLKANFGFSVLRHRLFKEKKDIWLASLIGLGVVGLFPAFYGYGKLIKVFYDGLKPLGQEHVLLTFAILSGQFLVLIFGLYYVISAFYFSRDLEMLIPLPLKPFEVIISKFAVILVNEHLTIMAFVLPVFLYFGILSKAGFSYWANALVTYLFLPVIPLAVVSLLVIGMMRVINISRKKDVLIILGSLILIMAVMGVQFVLNRSAARNQDPQAMLKLLASPDGLLSQVGSRFPPSIWATKALAHGFTSPGFSHLFLFLGTSFVLFCGILVVAEILFYRGLIGIAEVTGHKKALSRTEISRRVSSGRRPVTAIFQREWRIMNRTPIFLLNGVLTVIIFPLIFVIMTITDTGDTDPFFLMKALASTKSTSIILAAACFMAVSGSLNGTSSSTFSREGSHFWMSKVIPVTPGEQVAAKFLHSYIIALLGIVAALVVLIAVFDLKVLACATALAFALVTAAALTALGMMIDLARPLLDWISPQKAIKQNLNVLLALCADLGVLAILGFSAYLMSRAGISGNAVLVILFGFCILLLFLSFRLLLKFAEKRYREIEV